MGSASWRVILPMLLAWSLDGLTKGWAERALIVQQPVLVADSVVRLTLSYNTGVAFGLFATGSVWLTLLISLIIGALLIWLVTVMRTDRFPLAARVPLGLLLGGALANLVDRLADGRVTDFLDIGLGAVRWPTFNLADTAITLGITCLLLTTVHQKHTVEMEK